LLEFYLWEYQHREKLNQEGIKEECIFFWKGRFWFLVQNVENQWGLTGLTWFVPIGEKWGQLYFSFFIRLWIFCPDIKAKLCAGLPRSELRSTTGTGW